MVVRMPGVAGPGEPIRPRLADRDRRLTARAPRWAPKTALDLGRCAWQVQDSNLRRRKPTDLQSVLLSVC